MKIRAAFFDVYCTLLEVERPPVDAERRWQRLFQDFLNVKPSLSRVELASRCDRVIARLHAQSRSQGIPWPEIHWPTVMIEVLPELARLKPARREDFLFEHMQLGRTLRLASGAADLLRWLRENQVELGLASNAQSYTLRELGALLLSDGLTLSIFEPQLSFWSYEHGFAKPDPHVFQLLTARLQQRGIQAGEALMVGDRLDNDIESARVLGWQTWELSTQPRLQPGGTWSQLREWLTRRISAA